MQPGARFLTRQVHRPPREAPVASISPMPGWAAASAVSSSGSVSGTSALATGAITTSAGGGAAATEAEGFVPFLEATAAAGLRLLSGSPAAGSSAAPEMDCNLERIRPSCDLAVAGREAVAGAAGFRSDSAGIGGDGSGLRPLICGAGGNVKPAPKRSGSCLAGGASTGT